MELGSIIIFVILIVLAILALKFLAGVLRTVVSLVLFIIAVGFVLYWLTGKDAFGVVGFVTSFLP